jgi:hypothetical protein
MSSHFGKSSPNGLPNLQRTILGVKTHWIEEFLISLEKALGMWMSKMGLHDPFGHLTHEL